MGLQVVQLISRVFGYSFELFTTLLDKTGLMPFYLSMLSILIVVTYLLTPFLVPLGSDKAKRSNSHDNNDS